MSQQEKVYSYLLEEILSGRLAPGAPVIELDVSARLETSRTPVREALKALAAEGLLSQYPARGTFVSEVTPYDVEEIFSLRIALECFALQLGYERITEEEIKEREAMFQALDPAASPAGDFARADRSLHALIVDKAGNLRLKQFLNTLNVQIERFRRIAAVEPTRLANSKQEHLEILARLRDKDLPASQRALAEHLNKVKASTLETASMAAMKRFSKKGL